MESASARLGQVWSELKAVARQLQATHRSKTSNSIGVFQHLRCHATLRIACVIFTLTAPRTDLALEFWKFKRRNKPDADKWTEKDMLVQFNEFTIIEKDRMLNASDKRWNGHSATGKAWLREQGLRDWVYGQNTNRGVAPANEHLWKENMSWLAKDVTGALRPERTPRWKRRQVNQWALRWATRSRVLRGAFKDDERLTLETLRAKVVNQKPTALNNNSYPKTRPQNQAPKTVTKMMTIVHVYTIRKPVSRACFCDLVFAPVIFFLSPGFWFRLTHFRVGDGIIF